MFISSDAGSTWQSSRIARSSDVLAAFVLDATRAWAVVAGPGTTEFNGAPTDVLNLIVETTQDGGATWAHHVVPGSHAGTSQAMLFTDARHGYLLCSAMRHSSGQSSVLRTSDGGTTWTVAGTAAWLGSLFTASDSRILWAGAEQEAGPVGHPLLDVSRDGGSDWSDARLPGFEGITGGGDRWLPAPPSFGATSGVAVAVTDSNGSTATTIFRSADRGGVWVRASDVPSEPSAGLAILDGQNWLLPLDNPFRLAVTHDGAASWQVTEAGDLPNGGWIDWIAAIDATDVAALVPLESSSLGGTALYISHDAGRTWLPADLGIGT